MTILIILLLALAAACFIASAVSKPSRFNLTAFGLFFWVLTQLIPALVRIGCVILIASIFVGCAGSGEGGKWTPQDTAAAMGAIDNGITTYDRVAHPEYYRPTYVAPVVPVYGR